MMRYCIWILFLFGSSLLHAQNGDGLPLDYLQEINDAYQPVLKKHLEFARSFAQGQPVELVNRQRAALLGEIRNAQSYIEDMPPHRGNTALRDSMVQFLEISYDVVNEDFARIVDMEKISEGSYDQMEAFLRAQEEAYIRMGDAAKAMKKAEETFAKNFGVRLVNSDDRFSRQLNELNETFSYYNKIYLLFFSSYQQELDAFRAIESQDAERMEEERRKLNAISSDGLAKLDRTGAYKGDRSLRNVAADNLRFYQEEASQDLVPMVTYYQSLNELKRIKEEMENTENAGLRKELMNRYNELVRNINSSGKELDAITNRLNQQRAKHLDEWNQTSESFLRKYIQ